MSFESFSVKFSITGTTLLECGPHFWLLTRLAIVLRKFIVELRLRLGEIFAKGIAFWWSIHYRCLFRSKWIWHILLKVVIWIILRLPMFLVRVTILGLLLNLLRLFRTIHGTSICRGKTHSWLFLRRGLQYLIVFLHRGPLLFPLVLMRIAPSLTVILLLTRRRVISEGHRICCINTAVAVCIIHANFWFWSRQIRFEHFPVISSITPWSSLSWLWSSQARLIVNLRLIDTRGSGWDMSTPIIDWRVPLTFWIEACRHGRLLFVRLHARLRLCTRAVIYCGIFGTPISAVRHPFL